MHNTYLCQVHSVAAVPSTCTRRYRKPLSPFPTSASQKQTTQNNRVVVMIQPEFIDAEAMTEAITAVPQASSTMSVPLSSSPFEVAIKQFLTTIKDKDKDSKKNPFLNELQSQDQDGGQAPVTGPQSRTSAASLTQFVEDTIAQKRTTRTVKVLERVKPFIDVLRSLMAFCEKTLQAAPFGVSIAFSGARIVLDLAIKMQFLDTIVESMTEIGNNLKCYEKLADAFEMSPDVQDLLVASYVRVIKFWYHVSGILSSRMVRNFAKIMVKKPIDQELKTALEGLRLDGDKLILLTTATTAQQTRKEKEAAERQAVIKWIINNSPVDVRVNLREQVALHQKGTCQWILEDPRFQTWSKSKENAVLWYNAKPGSGKSVLAASIIQHLQTSGKKVAHFFYTFNDPSRKLGLSGLRSLALQLSGFLDALPEKLVDRYKKEMANHVDGVADLHTALHVVHELLRCDEVYVVVDGLDECRDEQAILLSFGHLIAMRSYSTVKWMFTSRDHDSIRHTMQSLNAVEITAEREVISDDIRKYFLARHPDQTRFIEEWTDGEDNFLYTKLICDTMAGEGHTSVAEIEDALKSYPKDLNGYYMRALVKLSNRSENEQEMARRTFLTLIGAAQSISLNELTHLLAIPPRGSADAADFDPRRLPSPQAIKDLCSPLVDFCASKDGDAPDNPLVALCHKTVEDFFIQNPANISPDTTGFTPALHRYFVSPHRVNERIGLDCLTYLQYARYQKASDDHAVDLHAALARPVAQEHAFLPYAVTFWSLHLGFIVPTSEVREAVHAFLASPAFWTCLAAQTVVSPYLFGNYSSSARGGGRYFKMGVKAPRTAADGADGASSRRVGLPLPFWLDASARGRALDRSLCFFAEEWREVLLTCPRGLELCPRLERGEDGPSCWLAPLRTGKIVRVAYLEEHLPGKCPTGRTALLDISFRGRTLWASLVCFKSKGQVERLQVPLFSKQVPLSDDHELLIDPAETTKWNTAVVGQEVQAWKVDPHSLSLKRITKDCSTEHKTPLAFSKEHIGRRKGTWQPVSTQEIPPHGETSGPLQAIHMAWIPERPPTQPRGGMQAQEDSESSEEESDDDSVSEASDSSEEGEEDSDDDSDASEAARDEPTQEPSDTDYDDAEADDGFITDCLVVSAFGGQPSWYPWARPNRVWSRVIGASHPSLPIFVVSYAAREIQVIDLIKRTKETKHLPEIADLEEEPLANLRELRFSPCGNYLHFLNLSFHHLAPSSTSINLTLSTFLFDPQGSSDHALQREDAQHKSAKCTYALGESLADLPAPLALTHWTDAEVLVALPPLTCDPRIVKVRLPQVSSEDGQIIAEEKGDHGVCTLREAVYFPTSTPRRNARLLYRAAKDRGHGEGSGSSYLFLALDTCVPGVAKVPIDKATEGATATANTLLMAADASTSAAASQSTAELPAVSPPVVLRWKVAAGDDGWRAWNPKEDGQASDLKRGLPIEKLLQGNFVDADRVFSVSTRGGLNWKRKGHLSCATFG